MPYQRSSNCTIQLATAFWHLQGTILIDYKEYCGILRYATRETERCYEGKKVRKVNQRSDAFAR